MDYDTPIYDSEEKYRGFTIKRFPFMSSGGGPVGGGQIEEIQYYHFHIYSPNSTNHQQESASLELAKQYIDSISL